eukprot:m51a1_g1784 hypothetical protein (624) ;mRNA; f:353494-356500
MAACEVEPGDEEAYAKIPNYLLSPCRVVTTTPTPEWRKLPLWKLYNNGVPDIPVLREHLRGEGRLEDSAALRLLFDTREMLAREPNLLLLKPPFYVVGDIHGQFYDLLAMMEAGGEPPTSRFLFLGDYVDRGSFGVEACFYLFALKLAYPDHVFMLRGNHECRLLTGHFNFKRECICKYSEDMWLAFMEVFDCLPTAAETTNDIGRFLFVHGGISPSWSKVEDINTVNRFMEPPEFGLFSDALWSDPLEEETAFGLTAEELINWRAITFVDNPTRGCGCIFGLGALAPFLAENNLVCVVRAHEVQKEGFHLHRFFCDESVRDMPMMITLFSAPNYCDMYRNAGAVMMIESDTFDFRVFDCVPHPFWLPKFANAFDVTLPLITQKMTNWLTRAMTSVRREDQLKSDKIAELPSKPEAEAAAAGGMRVQEDNAACEAVGIPRRRDPQKRRTGEVESFRMAVAKRASLKLIPQGIITDTVSKFDSPESQSRWKSNVPTVSLEHLKGVLAKARAQFLEKASSEVGVAFIAAREDDEENERRPPVEELTKFFETKQQAQQPQHARAPSAGRVPPTRPPPPVPSHQKANRQKSQAQAQQSQSQQSQQAQASVPPRTPPELPKPREPQDA